MGFGAHGFALALCLCLPLAVSAQMFRPDKTDTAKRCAICHFEWVYPFFIEHRDGELIAQPKQKQVAAAEMCFSCHDGSVADSRKTLLHDPGHGTGVKPSSAVTIPAEFPLDQGGHRQCATCHTPHAVASGDSTGVGFFLEAPIPIHRSVSCATGKPGEKRKRGTIPSTSLFPAYHQSLRRQVEGLAPTRPTGSYARPVIFLTAEPGTSFWFCPLKILPPAPYCAKPATPGTRDAREKPP